MAKRILVFYDDQCGLCRTGISWLRRLDPLGRTEAAPLDSRRVAEAGLSAQECARRIHVVEPSGRVRRGWDALAYLARRFPATWVIGAVGAVPPFNWIAAGLYRLVAANRYLVSNCGSSTCRVHARGTRGGLR